jgi:hypothetical protein
MPKSFNLLFWKCTLQLCSRLSMADQQLDLKYTSVDIDLCVDQLEEIDPISFRLAFGLTHEAAAEELGIEPQTMRSYVSKQPSKRVRKLAAAIAKRWIREERPLVHAHHLVSHSSIAPNSKRF